MEEVVTAILGRFAGKVATESAFARGEPGIAFVPHEPAAVTVKVGYAAIDAKTGFFEIECLPPFSYELSTAEPGDDLPILNEDFLTRIECISERTIAKVSEIANHGMAVVQRKIPGIGLWREVRIATPDVLREVEGGRYRIVVPPAPW